MASINSHIKDKGEEDKAGEEGAQNGRERVHTSNWHTRPHSIEDNKAMEEGTTIIKNQKVL